MPAEPKDHEVELVEQVTSSRSQENTPSNVGAPENTGAVSERKLKWKLDLFILPLISSVYFFASMVSDVRFQLAILSLNPSRAAQILGMLRSLAWKMS
jgi:hypothetical protein